MRGDGRELYFITDVGDNTVDVMAVPVTWTAYNHGRYRFLPARDAAGPSRRTALRTTAPFVLRWH